MSGFRKVVFRGAVALTGLFAIDCVVAPDHKLIVAAGAQTAQLVHDAQEEAEHEEQDPNGDDHASTRPFNDPIEGYCLPTSHMSRGPVQAVEEVVRPYGYMAVQLHDRVVSDGTWIRCESAARRPEPDGSVTIRFDTTNGPVDITMQETAPDSQKYRISRVWSPRMPDAKVVVGNCMTPNNLIQCAARLSVRHGSVTPELNYFINYHTSDM